MTPTQIPDPATLEGEELNYWCGMAAGKKIIRDSVNACFEVMLRDLSRWNPTQDAAQCLALTPKCNVVPHPLDEAFMAFLYDNEISIGKTELEARCRAFLEAKRRQP